MWVHSFSPPTHSLVPFLLLSLHPSNQSVCQGVGPPGFQVSLEEQAFLLLTDPERQTMGYYLREYKEGHIGLEPLTMALFELFNTHAKVTIYSVPLGSGIGNRMPFGIHLGAWFILWSIFFSLDDGTSTTVENI